jgi:selenide, water dikinase
MSNIKLTQYSKASGCGCKIAPSVLKEVLKTDFTFHDKNLLIGYEKADDAAVYQLNEHTAIISTTDFFMPIVDDAFDFGRIAACNALSDVYAMGGTPLMAVAILGWPTQQLGVELAARTLDGARTVCAQAGITLAGGHSIESTEPFFGLAVTGHATLTNLKQNNTIQSGDFIFLTKALGTGILSTALKRGVLQSSDYENVLDTMTTLNKIGADLAQLPFVTAMTDVTGFGLVGHALEMISDSGLCIQFEKDKIPLLPNLLNYQQQFIYPDNTTRNFSTYQEKVSGMVDLDFMLYCDPQTSGGLLFTIKEESIHQFEDWCKQKQLNIPCIGKVLTNTEADLKLVNFI